MLLLAVCCAAARADEIVVQPDGTASLTEAVAKARPGDIIHLAAGVYTQETETYPIVIDKPLTLIGEEGAVLESPAFTPLLNVTAPDVTVENIDFHLLRYGIVGMADWLSVKDCSFLLYDDTYRVHSCGIRAGRSQERLINRQPLYRLWRMPCRTAHYRKQLWKTGAYGIV